ncbi:MAG: flagellar biosynthetic protein FliR [Aquifex sp.]|nr:MAG: flagellar biosynthetic protein FliR [Aquifex sp.]
MDKIIDENFLITLLLSYFRVAVFLFMFPFFGSNYIPLNVRLFLTFSIAFAIISFIEIKPIEVKTFMEFILYAINESLFGFITSLILRLILDALLIAGEIIALHTGLGFLQMFIPGQPQMSLFAGFFFLYGTLIFLTIGGAEVIILALGESFINLPIGSFNLFSLDPEVFLNFFYESFNLGVKVSLPVFLSALILNLILAVVNRFIPQMNVFMVGLPLQVLVGFTVLLIALPIITITISDHLLDYFEILASFIRELKKS